MLAQDMLGFQYEAEGSSVGLTSLWGLLLYLELIEASGLDAAIHQHLRAAEDPGLAGPPDGGGAGPAEPGWR
jgi:hypothetical protein